MQAWVAASKGSGAGGSGRQQTFWKRSSSSSSMRKSSPHCTPASSVRRVICRRGPQGGQQEFSSGVQPKKGQKCSPEVYSRKK
eukprot:4856394-Pyramimonas_sp.AAC.3